MPLLFIIVPIIVAIVFFYIGKKIGIKKTLAEQEEQHKAFVKKLAQQKLKSNMHTYNEFGPKSQTNKRKKSPYLMKNDPRVRAVRSYPNQEEARIKELEKQVKNLTGQSQKTSQKSHIPWALIGAWAPEILKKAGGDDKALKQALEELRKNGHQ